MDRLRSFLLWDDPQVDGAAVDGLFLGGFPVVHAPTVGDDSGAGLELPEELGPQPQVDGGQQVESDHGGVVNVGIEQIVFFELHQGFDARLAGVFAGFLDKFGIDVDAHSARAVILGGGDDDAPVAAAEVIDDVAPGNAGEPEHAVDDGIRAANVGDIGTMPGLVFLLGRGAGDDKQGGGELTESHNGL